MKNNVKAKYKKVPEFKFLPFPCLFQQNYPFKLATHLTLLKYKWLPLERKISLHLWLYTIQILKHTYDLQRWECTFGHQQREDTLHILSWKCSFYLPKMGMHLLQQKVATCLWHTKRKHTFYKECGNAPLPIHRWENTFASKWVELHI